MKLFDLSRFQYQPALIDGDSGRTLTYDNLAEASHQFIEPFGSQKILVFLFINSTLDHLIAYVALLNQGHAIAAFDDSLHQELKERLIALYRPHFISQSAASGPALDIPEYVPQYTTLPSLAVWRRGRFEESPQLHPDLQLLLSTSGTTGSAKLIRLSAANISSNARAISSYLAITPEERAIATLPFHYSYGLSVLHSHLISGASTVLTSQSIVQEGFWIALNRWGCTSLAGVPYTYQMLDRIGFDKLECPTLRTMTQAGGRLLPHLTIKFDAIMKKRNGQFFTMYGQTEATARIAYLPPSYLPEKAGAIGIPIPGGKIQLLDGKQEIKECGREGELVYIGPNVMLGYAEHPQDLALGDMQHGILYTGDLGYRDPEGIFFLTGRIKRISKVYGQRINLHEIELAAAPLEIAATSDDTTIRLYYEIAAKPNMEQCIAFLSKRFHLALTTFECVAIEHWPLTSSGKIDYTRLK